MRMMKYAVLLSFSIMLSFAMNSVEVLATEKYTQTEIGIADFLGSYSLEPPTDETINCEVMTLDFDGEGNFYQYCGLKYGTTGTTRYYYYDLYELSGNILTCYYDEVLGYNMESTGEEGGSHTFLLAESGNLVQETSFWYRQQEESPVSNKLLPARRTDFPTGKYSENATFLGINEIRRKDIESITFTSILEDVPQDAWDVSAAQDGSVMAWLKEESGIHLMIGAYGGVIANEKSSDLFRCCSNLKRVDFNNSFLTTHAAWFDYMFCNCERLGEIAGLDSFDTAKAVDMRKMFAGCSSLNTLDVREIKIPAVYQDIYEGTKWEGSSPMMDLEEEFVPFQQLLNYEEIHTYQGELEVESLKLTDKVRHAYDQVLSDAWKNQLEYLDNSALSFWENYARIMDAYELTYGFFDLTGDGIPEMILVQRQDYETYSFSIYTFVVTPWRVEQLVYYESCEKLYFYAEKGLLQYFAQDEWKELIWEDGEFEPNKGTVSYYAGRKIELSSIQKNIWTVEYDLDSDGDKEEIVFHGVKATNDSCRFLLISIDNIGIYSYLPEHYFSDIEGKFSYGRYLNLRLLSDGNVWWNQLLTCKKNKIEPLVSVDELIEEFQIIKEGNTNKFENLKLNPDGVTFSVDLIVNTIKFGELTFTIRDCFYYDKEFHQGSWFFTGNNLKKAYTLLKDVKVYRKLWDAEENFFCKKGEVLYVMGFWLYNGLLWAKVTNLDEEGWLPAFQDVAFEEVTYQEEDDLPNIMNSDSAEAIYYGEAYAFPSLYQLYEGASSARNGGDEYLYEEAILTGLMTEHPDYEIRTMEEDEFLKSDSLLQRILREQKIWYRMEIETAHNEKQYPYVYTDLVMLEPLLYNKEKYLTFKEKLKREDIKGNSVITVESTVGEDELHIVEELPATEDAVSTEELPAMEKELPTAEEELPTSEEELPTAEEEFPTVEAEEDKPNEETIDVQYDKPDTLMARLAMEYMEQEPAVCYIDLDQDGLEEAIIRMIDMDSWGGGQYIYHVYQYSSDIQDYNELQDTVFYSMRSDQAVRYWKAENALVLDVSMGEPEYEVLTLTGKQWESITITNDLSDLPSLSFLDIGKS